MLVLSGPVVHIQLVWNVSFCKPQCEFQHGSLARISMRSPFSRICRAVSISLEPLQLSWICNLSIFIDRIESQFTLNVLSWSSVLLPKLCTVVCWKWLKVSGSKSSGSRTSISSSEALIQLSSGPKYAYTMLSSTANAWTSSPRWLRVPVLLWVRDSSWLINYWF